MHFVVLWPGFAKFGTKREILLFVDDVAPQRLVDTGSGSALDLMRPFVADIQVLFKRMRLLAA